MAVSSEPLRSALIRLASLNSMRALPKPPSAVSFEPPRSAWARPAPFSLIAPAPMNVASLKSPYDRCAPIRSSSLFTLPSAVRLHAIGQLLSPAARCLSISTVQGGAGDGGGLGGLGEGEGEGKGGGDGSGGGDSGGDGLSTWLAATGVHRPSKRRSRARVILSCVAKLRCKVVLARKSLLRAARRASE